MERSDRAHMPVRKFRLEDQGRESDLDYWRSLTPSERFVEVWRLSQEVYAFAGLLPAEPGLRGSPARVVRG